MKRQLFLLLFLSTTLAFSQSSSKEYSKDIALYRAKFYIINEVFGGTSEYEKFVIDPLAASKSSEITSIYYEGRGKKGLALGFFDDFWANGGPGTSYQGYGFKNLNFDEAYSLLNKIEAIIKNERKFLNADDNENNIYFDYLDMTIIIYREGPLAGRIRLAWKGFDGEWENTAFRRTKRRFEKSMEE